MSVKIRWCQRCKAEIPQARLEALPETRLCLACSAKVGGDFQVSYVQENLAKSGSLKKNYGSINVQKTRRPIKPVEDDTAT